MIVHGRKCLIGGQRVTEDVAHVTASPIRRRTSGLALDWRVSSRAEPLHRRPHWFDLARALFWLRVSAAVADGEVCRSGAVWYILGCARDG